jgi:hypothetical protein
LSLLSCTFTMHRSPADNKAKLWVGATPTLRRAKELLACRQLLNVDRVRDRGVELELRDCATGDDLVCASRQSPQQHTEAVGRGPTVLALVAELPPL